ncbi:DUF614 domain-containing protein [Paracoccidioides lutzii Pb01]|uniref:DUF614 domain-containing protein n=1 Tax=Paracoccidioides lutzii (strain ATCC MYA-826 / Pb01) TaxID=502779 RepID=C1H2K9_PARBA|nr:DUF614 domain-containing protein [Paracoccidioides lutzii Pb01]EEH33953.1 DUF614 domain-containing protein [Paracoccidioides lutzii Pb01]
MATAESTHNPSWTHSFWDILNPIDTCLVGWFCPCILFGKTQARMEDPTLQNYSPINDNCLIFCGLNCFAVAWLLVAKRRIEMREKYGITQTHLEKFLKMEPGSIKAKHNFEESHLQDCLSAFFCPCFALVQGDKEVIARQAAGQGYQKPQSMSYPPA